MLGLRKYSARKEINTAIDFLWENSNIEFSLNTLCHIVNLSPYYFVRLFKEHTGKTPYEYYLNIKISKALIYLKSKRYSITEVSFILGFSSHSHFSFLFLISFGFCPADNHAPTRIITSCQAMRCFQCLRDFTCIN